MTETYRRILDRISKQPEVMKNIAKRALTWVITAKRPLKPIELAIVVAIDHTSTSTEELEQRYKPQVVIGACCGLLSIESDAVRPIHFTVQEFLKGPIGGIGNDIEANAELARSSIRYMLCEEHIHIRKMYTGVECRFNGMSYIWRFWDHHIRCVPLPLPDDLTRLLRRFLTSDQSRAAYCTRSRELYWGRCSALDICAIFDLLPLYSQFYSFGGNTGFNDFKEAIFNAARGGATAALCTLLDLVDPAQHQFTTRFT